MDKLYDAGYRKVADDEIVIKKSEYENLRLAQYNAQTTINENFLLALEKIEQAKQDTAREILQEFLKEFVAYACVGDYYTATEIYNKIQEIANKYGIKLED